MTTVQQLIDRIRRDHLAQGRVEPRNKLSSPALYSDETLAFTYDLDNIMAATMISIGLEDMYVWSADPTSKTAVVDRGADGTTAVAHTTTERVRVSPRWSDYQILRAVNDELANLYAQGLYKVATTDVTFTGATIGYPMPAGVSSVRKVWAEAYAGEDWQELGGWKLEHNQDTTDFPTGNALYVRLPGYEGRTLHVEYRGEFTPLATLADVVATVSGLPASAEDVVALGAAISILVGREVSHRLMETQGSTRRAEENPPGAAAQSFTPIIRQYQARLAAEKKRLARIYGS